LVHAFLVEVPVRCLVAEVTQAVCNGGEVVHTVFRAVRLMKPSGEWRNVYRVN
jgi:hypothetical protein